MNKTCKICGQTMQIKYIPKGKIFLWKYPDNMKSDWFDRREFSLGSDYKLNKDLKYLYCSCGYSEYKEIEDE